MTDMQTISATADDIYTDGGGVRHLLAVHRTLRLPEQFRIKSGQLATPRGAPGGAFMIPFDAQTLRVIATDGRNHNGAIEHDWEHVSVSLPNRCPNWREMCHVRDLFWPADVWVQQFHPAASDYVNRHPYTLHMWRKVGGAVEVPPLNHV